MAGQGRGRQGSVRLASQCRALCVCGYIYRTLPSPLPCRAVPPSPREVARQIMAVPVEGEDAVFVRGLALLHHSSRGGGGGRGRGGGRDGGRGGASVQSAGEAEAAAAAGASERASEEGRLYSCIQRWDGSIACVPLALAVFYS